MKTSNDLSHPALEETLEPKPQHQDAPRTPLKESSQKRKNKSQSRVKTTIISRMQYINKQQLTSPKNLHKNVHNIFNIIT